MDRRPHIMKDVKIKYNDEEYDNIIMFSRSPDYSSFCYLDQRGNEVNVSLKSNEVFDIVNSKS